MTLDRNNTPRTAKSLGVLDKVVTVRDSLRAASGDLVDYYSFNLNARSSVALSIRGLRDNVQLQLLDSQRRRVGSSFRSGRAFQALTRNLAAGQYFIAVTIFGSATRYTLRAIGTPFPTLPDNFGGTPTIPGGSNPGGTPPGSGSPNTGSSDFPAGSPLATDPGYIPALAFDTGALSTTKSYRQTVGGADTADFYRFNITQPSQVTVRSGNFQGGIANTTLVYDLNDNGIADPNEEIGSGATITRSLGTGTYFVGVTSTTNASVTYDVSLAATPITRLNAAEAPIGLGGAVDLGAVTGNRTVTQLVGSADNADVYKFNVTAVSNFSILLNSTQQTGDVTVSLVYDGDGNGIANPGILNEQGLVVNGDFAAGGFTTGGAGGASLALDRTLGVGSYYLIVTQKELSDNSTYDLNLFVNNAVPGLFSTDPGNTLSAAFDLGALTTDRSFKQFVGSVDKLDTYKFTISQTRNVIIRYNGSPQAVALRFGKDFNSNNAIDFTEDFNGNELLDTGEDLNGNGKLDLSGEMFPGDFAGDVMYSPLPPLYDASAKFTPEIDGFLTTVPTDIYARLTPGTYFLQVNAQAITTDLGDDLVRYGSANVLYNLSFLLDG